MRYARISDGALAISLAVLGFFLAWVVGTVVAFLLATLVGAAAGTAVGRWDGRQLTTLLGSAGQASRGWRDPSPVWALVELGALGVAGLVSVLGQSGRLSRVESVNLAFGFLFFAGWALASEELTRSMSLADFERASGKRVECRMGGTPGRAWEYRTA